MKQRGLGAALKRLFGGGITDEASFEELEDLLIQADLGAATTMTVVAALREQSKRERISSSQDLVRMLGEQLRGMLTAAPIELASDRLNVLLFLGVNGVGKTTTIAKLAHHFKTHEHVNGIVLAAGDTFRAAAVEQLQIHAERLGVRIVSQGSGGDPGAVVYDAVTSAVSRGERVVMADTAGRMHTKSNLVGELAKIVRIVEKRASGANLKKLLVVDATTGQNGLRQAETFHQAVGVDAVVLAKYDSTAKGGILIPIARELGLPIAYLGVGEHYDGLRPFDPERYVAELLEAT